MKYNECKLNILDIEKKTLLFKPPIRLSSGSNSLHYMLSTSQISNSNRFEGDSILVSSLDHGWCSFICCFPFVMCLSFDVRYNRQHPLDDVCPSNGNLLAASTQKDIKIFDKRGSTIVKTFDKVHSSRIRLTSYLNFLR
mgnify:CR=1 FL=1